MEKFDNDISNATAFCIENRIHFCLYRLPGIDSEAVFFANPSPGRVSGGRNFFIGKWGQQSKDFVIIADELSAKQACEKNEPCRAIPDKERQAVHEKSTEKEEYLQNLSILIEEIKKGKADKVVISRIRTSERPFNPRQILELAQKVFASYPSAFRYLYYTNETGIWLGASPELLLEFNAADFSVRTTAIAGTQAEDCDEWDKKNQREQQIVKEYIIQELNNAGIDTTEGDTYTLVSGHLRHIATPIKGSFSNNRGQILPFSIIDKLNPTPALCGFPKGAAIELIKRFEKHDRSCYGGVVGINRDDNIICYVNLRSGRISEQGITLYGGGGILSDSLPEMEWDETERKLRTIGNFL